MSHPIQTDLELLAQAKKDDDKALVFYETGFLHGRLANDHWTKVSDGLPKRKERYLVSNGKVVSMAEWNGSGFIFLTKPQTEISHWQLLPVIPRSEVGRD